MHNTTVASLCMNLRVCLWILSHFDRSVLRTSIIHRWYVISTSWLIDISNDARKWIPEWLTGVTGPDTLVGNRVMPGTNTSDIKSSGLFYTSPLRPPFLAYWHVVDQVALPMSAHIATSADNSYLLRDLPPYIGIGSVQLIGLQSPPAMSSH